MIRFSLPSCRSPATTAANLASAGASAEAVAALLAAVEPAYASSPHPASAKAVASGASHFSFVIRKLLT